MNSDVASPPVTRLFFTHNFPAYGYFGLAIIVLAELFLSFRVEIIGVYFTPIQWTGYILFIDAVNFARQGTSLILRRRNEFLAMLPWSIFCWVLFELYNLHLQNWEYVGLPENMAARLFGYAWAFATIFPGIIETVEFFEPFIHFSNASPLRINDAVMRLHIILGAVFLIVPLLLPVAIAGKLFVLIWVGFILLLDPIVAHRGGRSLLVEWRQGKYNRTIAIIVAGVVCGFLWEFWNYRAIGKWLYTVPIPHAGPKIFEMPLLGFLGFIPFAAEVFVMQEFLITVFPRLRNQP